MRKQSQVRLGAVGLVLALQTASMAASQAPVKEPAAASRLETQTGSRADVVYLDGQRLGGLNTLQGIPLSLIIEIR